MTSKQNPDKAAKGDLVQVEWRNAAMCGDDTLPDARLEIAHNIGVLVVSTRNVIKLRHGIYPPRDTDTFSRSYIERGDYTAIPTQWVIAVRVIRRNYKEC